MKYLARHNFIALLLLMLSFGTANAQEYRGTIAGSITDPNGAVVPAATVTVQNIETNVTATATTNDEGAYTFPLLLPGRYKVTAAAQNFQTSVREDIQLNVDDRLTVDFTLTIGTATEVNIVATDELLERGEVTLSTVVTERQITELPLGEGTAYNLATQAPGVSYTGNPMFSGPTANGNLGAIRTNGAVGNQITLDGSPNLTFDGGVAYTPPADALTQFKIQTSPFDAQTGFTAGSTVNVAVKSGTNNLHGSAYYFNRPGALTANNFFSNRAGQERPDRSYYRVGGQVNGPIYIPKLYNGRDKTFFMFSYERQLDKRAEPETFTVPTERMRRGDFSELIVNRNNIADARNIVIYNPFSGTQSGTNVVRQTFGCGVAANTPVPANCNIIPTNLLNPAAVTFLNLYPAPNIPGVSGGTVDNYFSNQVLERPYDSYLTRIDHNFNGNHRIFGKFFYSKSQEDRLNFVDVPDSITQGFEYRTNKGGNVDYTATLSSNFVLDIRSSYNDFVQERVQANPVTAASIGFAGIGALTSSSVFPRFDFTNYDTLGAERADFNEGLTRNFKLFSLQPTLTQIFGDHTLKYGYDYRRLMENRQTNGYNAGRFTFTGAFTSPASNSNAATQNQIGRDLAAFLLGVPTTSTIELVAPYDVTSNYHGFFVQDDWRVSPRLTLNLGLRYDLETGVREAEGRIVTGFDPAATSPLRASAIANYNARVPAGIPVSTFQNLSGGLTFASGSGSANQSTDKNNFQPRIGISYSLDDNTILRSGFGIFTSAFQIQEINQSGFTASASPSTTNNNGLNFLTNLNNPFPGGLPAAVGSNLGLNTLIGTTIGTTNATGPTETTARLYDRKNANYARFILGIQRQLPYDFAVEATYVHSRGYDLPVLRQLNYIPREYLNNFSGVTDGGTILNAIAATQTVLNTPVNNPFRGLAPQGTALNGDMINRRFLLTQYPQFQDLIVTEYNGSNEYNSLQLQLNKRMSRGISLNASYTLAREVEKTRRLNPQDEELTDTISTFDRPHRITFSGVAELPFGRGRQFFSDWHPVVDAVLGGWQFNAVYEWQSGEPLVLQNVFYDGDITQLENRIGQRDEQGRRYGVDIPAFDTTGFRVLDNRERLPNGQVNPTFNQLVTPGFGNNYTIGSQNTLRYIPYTLDNFRNQPFQKFDVGLTKNFNIREGMKLQVRVEAINALNWVYLGNGLQLGVTNAAFGLVSGQRNLPRDIQLGARFTF